MNVIEQLKLKLRRLVSRSTVSGSGSAGKIQRLQIKALHGETIDNVEHYEPYGYTSRPKAGAEAILLSPGGNRAGAIAIMVADRRYRLQGLAEGECALYDDVGNKVHLKQDGTIAVTSSTSVDITAPDVTMSGNLTVAGDVNAANVAASGNVEDGDGTMTEMRDIYNVHNHPGDSGGTTGTPTPPMT